MSQLFLIYLPLAIVLYLAGTYLLQNVLLKEKAKLISFKENQHAQATINVIEDVGCFGVHVPEDACLRRHFAANVLSMLITLQGGYLPIDQTERLHASEMIKERFEHCLSDPIAYDALLSEYEVARYMECQ